MILLNNKQINKIKKATKTVGGQYLGHKLVSSKSVPKGKAYLIDEQKLRKWIKNPFDIPFTAYDYDIKIRKEKDVFKKLDLLKQKYLKCSIDELLWKPILSDYLLYGTCIDNRNWTEKKYIKEQMINWSVS